MVEVFKTDVNCPGQAHMFLELMHRTYAAYKANFDLDDCDKILRIDCRSGSVNITAVINLLNKCGFHGEVLEDEVTIQMQQTFINSI